MSLQYPTQVIISPRASGNVQLNNPYSNMNPQLIQYNLQTNNPSSTSLFTETVTFPNESNPTEGHILPTSSR